MKQDTHTKEQKSIMPEDPRWELERRDGLERHEIWEGYNRQKSIEDRLYIFITHEQHFGKDGHSGFQYDQKLKGEVEWKSMLAWCKEYNKTFDDFKARYNQYAIQPEDVDFVDNDFENWEF